MKYTAIGVIWLAVCGVGWSALNSKPLDTVKQVPTVSPVATEAPGFQLPTTFTDHISFTAQCGSPTVGYLVVDVDGREEFINGTHRVNINLPGTHKIEAWGSCYPDP